ncbi:MAG: hypothetical protein EBV34_09840, partial [Betaproteobacteria bacterium]|nr:hypothetical protein [Betaproteobacteria bacterium]
MTKMNNVPLFPLSYPLFEEGVLPLQIFEPRYLDLVRECTREAKAFGVCMIIDGKETGQAAQHAEAESKPLEAALVSGAIGLDQYKKYLAQRWLIHRELESTTDQALKKDSRLGSL